MILSLQLYSVRKEIEKFGLGKVLAEVKAAGFDGVETAGDYGLGAAGLRKELEKAGLIVTSAHIPYAEITGRTDDVMRDMNVLGFSDAAIPWISREEFESQMPEIVENTKKVLKKFAENGLRLGYHNHKHEFENGKDYVADMLSAVDGLLFEPDICWISAAGLDPEKRIERDSGRIMTLHLKELGATEEENPVIGEGRAHVAECIGFAVRNGLKYVVTEFEGAEIPYIDYMRKSVEFIKKEIKK